MRAAYGRTIPVLPRKRLSVVTPRFKTKPNDSFYDIQSNNSCEHSSRYNPDGCYTSQVEALHDFHLSFYDVGAVGYAHIWSDNGAFLDALYLEVKFALSYSSLKQARLSICILPLLKFPRDGRVLLVFVHQL